MILIFWKKIKQYQIIYSKNQNRLPSFLIPSSGSNQI